MRKRLRCVVTVFTPSMASAIYEREGGIVAHEYRAVGEVANRHRKGMDALVAMIEPFAVQDRVHCRR